MLIDALIRAAVARPLAEEEAEQAFDAIMEGRATPVQMSALLVAMQTRGPSPEEIAGGVRALRRAMVAVPVSAPEEIVDTCGTGGGTVTTFNISTAAALVAAAAGVRVAKHGNRSFTSRCGSADVLEQLGVRLDLSPEQEARVLDAAGVVFMFAPLHHPAMRHIGPVRRELAMPTVMNVLGPLTNPAGARRQVVGVANPALLELIAEALRLLGHTRAMVVHGQPGLDELSPLGSNEIFELRDGRISRWQFDPTETMELGGISANDLRGGDPEQNARVVEEVLRGTAGEAISHTVSLNAGAAIYLAGKAGSLMEGITRAEEVISRGTGWERLQALRQASREV